MQPDHSQDLINEVDYFETETVQTEWCLDDRQWQYNHNSEITDYTQDSFQKIHAVKVSKSFHLPATTMHSLKETHSI